MQPLGKELKTAKIEGRPWKQELNRFLLQYRTAPHSTTGVSPAELLFNRTVQGKLPILKRKNTVNRHKEARQNEDKRQQYNKSYANEKRNVKESDIKVGDHVLVKQPKANKLTSNFNQTPYVVTHRNKTVVTARNKDGHVIERNVSHFKKIPKPVDTDDEDTLDELEEINPNNDNERLPQEPVQLNTNNPNNNNGNVVNMNLRRSTRVRKQPERYGQSVPSNIVT